MPLPAKSTSTTLSDAENGGLLMKDLSASRTAPPGILGPSASTLSFTTPSGSRPQTGSSVTHGAAAVKVCVCQSANENAENRYDEAAAVSEISNAGGSMYRRANAFQKCVGRSGRDVAKASFGSRLRCAIAECGTAIPMSSQQKYNTKMNGGPRRVGPGMTVFRMRAVVLFNPIYTFERSVATWAERNTAIR